ncbi:MAG: fibronectin type III domain-containing protein, partial [Oscillospiraceae bacterium]|nr:fibronectin type III domain-containing protein [Oscillospiraceae bacterium]
MVYATVGTGNRSNYSAGIGGGYGDPGDLASCDAITINGGTVIANGGSDVQDIGSGSDGPAHSVTIIDSNVCAVHAKVAASQPVTNGVDPVYPNYVLKSYGGLSTVGYDFRSLDNGCVASLVDFDAIDADVRAGFSAIASLPSSIRDDISGVVWLPGNLSGMTQHAVLEKSASPDVAVLSASKNVSDLYAVNMTSNLFKWLNKPDAPRDLTAAIDVGAGAADLTWSAPSSDGGTPVTGYEAQISYDGGATWET